jgi:hypothetical protein
MAFSYPCRATRDGCEAHLLICRPRIILIPRCTRRSLRYVARTFGTNGTGTQTFAYPRADGANELAHRFLPENLSHQAGTERRPATGSFYCRRRASTLRTPAAACRELCCNRVWRDHAGINELPLESPPLVAFGRQSKWRRRPPSVAISPRRAADCH